jgi:hypothetical protein
MGTEKQTRGISKVWLILILIVPLLIVALGADIIWEAFVRHVYDPTAVAKPSDVTYYTSVPPPPEARDFRVAAFNYGQARLTFVRFSAPADICRKYAAMVMPNAILKSLTQDQKYSDLMAIYAGTNELPDIHWFDLPYGHIFWTMQAGKWMFQKPAIENIPDAPDVVGADENTERQGYLTSSVRVDASRGVFYFLREN